MQSTTNLVEATANKIEERIRKMIKLRKEIISNTNNFREFKIMKSEIIHQLVEYESDFRQLSTIIKSVTTQNVVQKENADLTNKQLERLENKMKILEKENYKILETNQELQRKLGNVTNSNCDKDSYINDLLTKIGYLENIIKDYQKKYEVVRISSPETFEHNIPGRTNNYLSKYNEFSRSILRNSNNNQNNSMSSNYKKDLNLNYDYNRDYLNLNTNNIFDKREAMNSSSINLRPKSNTNYFKESRLGKSANLEAESRYNEYILSRSYVKNNLNEDFRNNAKASLNQEANKSIADDYNNNNISSNNFFRRSLLSDYTPHEKSNLHQINYQIVNNNNNNNVDFERSSIRTPNQPESKNEIRNSNLSNKKTNERERSNLNNQNQNQNKKQNNLNNINIINDLKEEKTPTNKKDISEIENNNNNNNNQAEFAKSNGAPFKKATESQLINSAESANNNFLSEKDKANLVSEILLKVFSSDNINTTLKRKYGEDFQFKLTDKNVENSFLLEVDKDVKVLVSKEKSENKPSDIKANIVNYKELRKSLRTYSPEGKYIDPNNPYFKKKILEMTKNSKNNNSGNASDATKYNFSELMKSSGGFDQTCKSLDNNNKNNNNEGKERSNSSNVRGFDLIKSSNNASKAQCPSGAAGYTSLKDYFLKNANFVKGLDRRNSPGKLN